MIVVWVIVNPQREYTSTAVISDKLIWDKSKYGVPHVLKR